MTVREALAAIRRRESRRPNRLPSQPRLLNMAAQIEAQFGAHPSAPAKDQLRALKARFWASGWTDVSPSDWQQAAWVMLDGPPYLADAPGFFAALKRELGRVQLGSGYRRLIYVYLRDFVPNQSAFQKTAGVIQDGLSLSALPSLQRWRSAHERFGLFAPKDGPRRVAGEILRAQETPDAVLVAAELKGELAGPAGFAGVVHYEVLNQLPELLRKGTVSSLKLSGLLASFASSGELRYPDQRPKMAEALLLP